MAGEPLITITGRVGKDPVMRFTQAGKSVASFAVAVTARIKEGDAWVDGETTWFDVSIWGRPAEAVIESVAKGSLVIVTGAFSIGKYTDKDGVERSKPQIKADGVGIVPQVKQVGGGAAAAGNPWD